MNSSTHSTEEASRSNICFSSHSNLGLPLSLVREKKRGFPRPSMRNLKFFPAVFSHTGELAINIGRSNCSTQLKRSFLIELVVPIGAWYPSSVRFRSKVSSLFNSIYRVPELLIFIIGMLFCTASTRRSWSTFFNPVFNCPRFWSSFAYKMYFSIT